jgi:hypothetical protein
MSNSDSNNKARDYQKELLKDWMMLQGDHEEAQEAEKEAQADIDAAFLAAKVAAKETEKARSAAEGAWIKIMMNRPEVEAEVAAEKADVVAWSAAVPLEERPFRAAAEGRCWNCFCKTADLDGAISMCRRCQLHWTSD